MSKSITATPELLGVFGSDNASTVNQIGDKLEVNVATVANSSNEINLALPYYSDLESKASAMSDDDMEVASGGVDACNGACAGSNVVCGMVDTVIGVANIASGVGAVASFGDSINASAAETAQEVAAQQRDK